MISISSSWRPSLCSSGIPIYVRHNKIVKWQDHNLTEATFMASSRTCQLLLMWNGWRSTIFIRCKNKTKYKKSLTVFTQNNNKFPCYILTVEDFDANIKQGTQVWLRIYDLRNSRTSWKLDFEQVSAHLVETCARNVAHPATPGCSPCYSPGQLFLKRTDFASAWSVRQYLCAFLIETRISAVACEYRHVCFCCHQYLALDPGCEGRHWEVWARLGSVSHR